MGTNEWPPQSFHLCQVHCTAISVSIDSMCQSNWFYDITYVFYEKYTYLGVCFTELFNIYVVTVLGCKHVFVLCAWIFQLYNYTTWKLITTALLPVWHQFVRWSYSVLRRWSLLDWTEQEYYAISFLCRNWCCHKFKLLPIDTEKRKSRSCSMPVVD